MTAALPIDPLLPEIVATLERGRCVVLRAAPGAGKTTRVPAALRDAGLAASGSVLVLEPRRIAARAAAEFVARARGGTAGGEVGYRVRFEQRGGASTRLWFVTEGIFGRQLASDPFLTDVGIVVLDEFHERSLAGDAALAVVRELQATVRPDLRLVVMSATLDTDALARYLGDAAVITSTGRAYPVDVEYAETAGDERSLPARVAGALSRVLADRGDVLVFLPGAAEIRRTEEAIAALVAAHDLDVVTLHGDQPLDQQERALRAGSRRRVVLATNVAETALTVDGVTTVIDSGLARVATLDGRHGLNRLRVVPVSHASADQRAGRAGRTAPGRCLRLWTRAEHAGRRARETPEVLRLDLARTLLELAAWGPGDVRALRWLDPPPPASVERGERLLMAVGAIDESSRAPTAIGRRMLELPAEPRVARMLVQAERLGCEAEAALAAALVTERDILLSERALGASHERRDRPAGDSDVSVRSALFEEAARGGFAAGVCHALGLDARAVRAVERSRRQLARLLGAPARGDGDRSALLRCLVAGFPDRVARRRAPGSPRALMVGGTGVVLGPESVVREAELFVAIDLLAGTPDARVRVASRVEAPWLAELFPDAVRTTSELVFDPARERVVERTRECYRDLVLAERIGVDVDPAAAGEVLAAVAREDPSRAAGIGDGERALLARLRFLARAMPELGLAADPNGLLADAVAMLAAGRRSLAELRAADVAAAIRGMLTARQRAALEREAPAHWRLPSGRTAPIRYEADRPPAVATRLQDLFGITSTPRVAGGRVAIVVEILAPNRRPVQITDDLESFWRVTYPEVRRQLRGRYPKHAWPEDPLAAPKRT